MGIAKLSAAVGGPARLRVVVLLACVLSLDSADSGAVGALAAQLERSFHIGNTRFGLLVTASSLTGALGTIPMGVLTDRVPRVRLLVVAISLWAVGMVTTGLAVNYLDLLLSRLALGVVTAAAGPTVASLTGDFFPAAERGRIYGYVLTGELLGAGGGLLLASNLTAILGWRAAFFLLAVPSIALAVALRRLLPEPARGGQSRLSRGADHIPPLEPDAQQASAKDVQRPAADSLVHHQVAARPDITPDDGRVLAPNGRRLTTWQAVRYVLGVPSNRVFIAASALGYFFLAGVDTFGVVFARGQFGLSQSTVSLIAVVIGAGAIAGMLFGGRVADHLIRAGLTDARVVIAGVSFIAAAAVAVPGFINHSLLIAVPLFVMAGALLAAPNPPLDAARLDVVPSTIWGRAESIRTAARTLLVAFAPLVFGLVSQLFGSEHTHLGAGPADSQTNPTLQGTHGLQLTFLVMLIPLAVSGLLLLRQRRRYLVDIAAAGTSERTS